MPQDTAQAARYCVRWKQAVAGGILHWYLRRLADDRRFWGYVHIRTSSLSENRSFDGEFPTDLWPRVASLLDRINESGDEDIAPSEFSDGLLLKGNASTGTVMIKCNATDRDHSDGAVAFYSLVDLLQPHVSASASLEDAA